MDPFLIKIILGNVCQNASIKILEELTGIVELFLQKKTSLLKNQYPAYLTYLISHELGHAYICLKDVTLHIHSLLIEQFIRKASDNKISLWHELPHEEYIDQFGIHIAECLYSREKLNNELQERINSPKCRGRKHLEKMLSLSSSNNFNNFRNRLINFSLPYKYRLIELWKNEKENPNGNKLTKCILDFEALFKPIT